MHRSLPSLALLLLASGVATISACADPGTSPGTSADTGSSPAATTAPVAALPGLVAPAWATHERYVGRLASTASVSVQVHLRMRDMDAARAELDAVSDPRNARYGQYLSDDDFAAKYGPSDDDVAAVRAHLESHGLRVTSIPGNKAFVAAQGSAAQIERAFSTRLGTFAVGASTRRAPIDPAALPPAVASRVGAVIGLSTPGRARPSLVRPGHGARPALPTAPRDATAPTATCSAYWGQLPDTADPAYGGGFAPLTYAPCQGYVPPQVRKMYGLDDTVRAGNDGRGQTIGIIDAWQSPTLVADAQQYAANHDPGFPLLASQITTQWVPGTPVDDPQEASDWYPEQNLDVQSAHTIAPGAHIAFVAAQSDSYDDLLAALNYVVTSRTATIVSNSWGYYEAYVDQPTIAAHEQVLLQGALKGIGFYFASGDYGDQALFDEINDIPTGPTASFPSSLSYVTSVGGTTIGLGPHDNVVLEAGWETGDSLLLPAGYQGSWVNYLEGNPDPGSPDAGTSLAWWPAAPGGYEAGSGGGTSVLYEEPWYQRGVVPRSLSDVGGKSWRVQPDVAMLGDSTPGFTIGETFGATYFEFPVGGTSLACPLFTASIALAQQRAGRSFGVVNPLLYLTAPLGSLRDVRPPRVPQVVEAYGNALSVDFRGPDSTLATAPGFDNTTGLGSANGATFLTELGLLGTIYPSSVAGLVDNAGGETGSSTASAGNLTATADNGGCPNGCPKP